MPLLASIASKPWLKYALLALIAYGAICLLLFIAQRKLIYFPSHRVAPLPPGFQPWLSPSGEHWGYKRTSGADECLFFFHGNGGNASGWSHAVGDFPGDIFVLEYPGYGPRPGTPSERSIKDAALEGFTSEQHRYSRIVVCGQSLGAAVTERIFSTAPDRIHTLVLITPFLSVAEIARSRFPIFPTRWILRDTMDLFDSWKKFSGRTRIVVAGQDEIIPRAHSLRYLAVTNQSVRVLELPHATHNTVDLPAEFWQEILQSQDD